jgi:hypothetical protein
MVKRLHELHGKLFQRRRKIESLALKRQSHQKANSKVAGTLIKGAYIQSWEAFQLDFRTAGSQSNLPESICQMTYWSIVLGPSIFFVL